MQHEALRLIRQFHNLTLTEVAEKIGVSKSYLSQIENGHRKPSLELLEGYAATFKMPLSGILLFAENVGAPDIESRIRLAVAGKALRMLNWLEEITNGEKRKEEYEKGAVLSD